MGKQPTSTRNFRLCTSNRLDWIKGIQPCLKSFPATCFNKVAPYSLVQFINYLYRSATSDVIPVLPFSRKFPFLRKFYCRKGKSKEEKKSEEI